MKKKRVSLYSAAAVDVLDEEHPLLDGYIDGDDEDEEGFDPMYEDDHQTLCASPLVRLRQMKEERNRRRKNKKSSKDCPPPPYHMAAFRQNSADSTGGGGTNGPNTEQ